MCYDLKDSEAPCHDTVFKNLFKIQPERPMEKIYRPLWRAVKGGICQDAAGRGFHANLFKANELEKGVD